MSMPTDDISPDPLPAAQAPHQLSTGQRSAEHGVPSSRGRARSRRRRTAAERAGIDPAEVRAFIGKLRERLRVLEWPGSGKEDGASIPKQSGVKRA